MPSLQEQYNEEVLQGHREALAALRELLAEETDPTERRRLACAILKVRPVKTPEPAAPPARTPSAEPPIPETRTAEDHPSPFWSGPTPAAAPAPFGDSALAHPGSPLPPLNL